MPLTYRLSGGAGVVRAEVKVNRIHATA